MKFTSPVYSGVSGSIAGLVYSHNAGGLYTRARSIPTNPGSAQQTAVRNALSGLASAWANTLTTAQRAAWAVYAANVPLIGPLGNARKVSGIAQFIRSNTPRLQAGLTEVDDGPTDYTLAAFVNPTITVTAASPEFSIVFDNTDTWATATGGAMLVYASRPQSPGINYFKGPYQLAGKIAGATVAPTSPQTLTSPFVLTAGQQVFFRVEVTNADGRLSSPFRAAGTAT